MLVASTKKMAKMLSEAVKNKGYKVKYITVNAEEYRWYIGDIFDAEYYGDWLPETNKFRAIEIVYPEDYYATPRYLTTQEIRNTRRQFRCETIEDLIERLAETVEI